MTEKFAFTSDTIQWAGFCNDMYQGARRQGLLGGGRQEGTANITAAHVFTECVVPGTQAFDWSLDYIDVNYNSY